MTSVVEVIDFSDLLDVCQIGYFIGKEACNFKSLERKTKVHLEMVEETEGGGPKVRVTGQPSSVTAARIELHELALRIIRGSFCHVVKIPSRLIPLIIGKHGWGINFIRDMHAVKIIVGDKEDNGFASLRIYGTFESIVGAVGMIKDYIDTGTFIRNLDDNLDGSAVEW